MNTLRMRAVNRTTERPLDAEMGADRRPRDTPRNYDFVAAGIAVVMGIIELLRIILSGPIHPGNSTTGMLLSGIVFCLLMGATAIGMALHRQLGWMLAVIGSILGVGHGIVVRSAGYAIGVVYMFGSLVLLALLFKTLHWYRSDVMASDVIARA